MRENWLSVLTKNDYARYIAGKYKEAMLLDVFEMKNFDFVWLSKPFLYF